MNDRNRCRSNCPILLPGFLAVLVTAGLGSGCSTPPPPPNVVLISLDTLRADRLGSYGYEKPTSPNLDRLAAEGVRFSDVVTQSTSTGSSHKAILAGLYTHALQDGNTTLAQRLREAGYETAAFVDGGYMSAIYGHDLGFDLYKEDFAEPAPPGGRPVRDRKGGGFAVILPAVSAWLRQRSQDRPFFLFLHTYDVHCPYDAPRELVAQMAGSDRDLEDVTAACGDIMVRGDGRADSLLQSVGIHYDAGVRHTDDMLGHFLDEEEQEGLLDDTLIIVISDHGESLGERNRIGHNLFHMQQLFVPWIMKGPGLPRGKVVDAPAQLVDVVPTVLDYLGLAQDDSLSGMNLMPVVEGHETMTAERLRITETGRGRALIRGPWILEMFDGRYEWLYRSDQDPLAETNLLNQMRPLRDELVEEYMTVLAEHGIVPGGGNKDETVPDEKTLEKLRSLGYVN